LEDFLGIQLCPAVRQFLRSLVAIICDDNALDERTDFELPISLVTRDLADDPYAFIDG
jgi:hypothetical protein